MQINLESLQCRERASKRMQGRAGERDRVRKMEKRGDKEAEGRGNLTEGAACGVSERKVRDRGDGGAVCVSG